MIAWFGTGIITLIPAIARLWILVPNLKDTDTTFVLAEETLWLIIEANLIIFCGSLPTFKIFLNHVAPMVLSESASATRRNSSGNNGTGSGVIRYAVRTSSSSGKKHRQFDTIDELELGDRYDSDSRWNGKRHEVGVTSVQDPRRSHSEASDEQAMMRTT